MTLVLQKKNKWIWAMIILISVVVMVAVANRQVVSATVITDIRLSK